LIGDKLPRTPSRLEPAGLLTRLTLGGVGGALLARRDGQSSAHAVLAALFGSGGAAAGAWLGAAGRRRASNMFDQDLPGAVTEDVAAIVLAVWAAR
ncbi:MAG: DUF4126 domain-containing protein, partial [Jatrophihabitantaceae bacterium]